MKLFSLFKKRAEKPGPLDDYWYKSFADLWAGKAGHPNADAAKNVAAVYACRQAICESFAMLPVDVFKKIDRRTREEAPNHPLYELLAESPNPRNDSMQFFEFSCGNVLDDGNSYSHISFTRAGKITELTPLIPDHVTVEIEDNNRVIYKHSPERGEVRTFDAREILHIHINSRDSILGRSPLAVAAETIKFSKSTLDHGNQFFDNNTFMEFVLETDSYFKNPETRNEFLKKFADSYGGTKNAYNPVLLEQGVKIKPLTMSNRDAQFMELRHFNVEEIARVFRVPPVFIQVMDKGMTFASVEQLAIMFVQYTIQPWVTRWERAINNQLLRQFGDTEHFVKFNVKALLRGDLAAQTESIVSRLQSGLLSINEGRAIDDRNPIEGGDEYYLPANNLSTIDKIDEEPVEPAQNSESAPEEEEERDFAPLFDDLLGRLETKERKAIKAALKKPDAIKQIERFYERHRDTMNASLQALVYTCFGKDQENLRAWSSAYCDSRVEDIVDLIKDSADMEYMRENLADWFLSVPTAETMKKLGETKNEA